MIRAEGAVRWSVAAASLVVLAILPTASPAGAGETDTYIWTGPYFGAQFGIGWRNGQKTDIAGLPTPELSEQANSAVGLDTSGAMGGAQVGYNWQLARLWLLGIEADLSATGIDGDRHYTGLTTYTGTPLLAGYVDLDQKLEWLGTVRGRLGVLATERLMIFATGGLAFGRGSYSVYEQYTTFDFARFKGKISEDKLGWVLGGGAEWAFIGDWSAKLEYLYVDLGEETVLASPLTPNPPYAVQARFETSEQILRIGINHKLDFSGAASTR